MTTQSYYGARDLEPFGRSSHQSMATSYHDRAYPYGYPESRQEPLRAEYSGRPTGRAIISELDGDPQGGGSARRRIAVACSRCRRRKIKCSGDPGNGAGCGACRAACADVSSCTFIRVNSSPLGIQGVDPYPPSTSVQGVASLQTLQYGAEIGGNALENYPNTARPSIPSLQTRGHQLDFESRYDHSPVDAYPYSSSAIPRQNSFITAYATNDVYQSWPSSGSMSLPVSSGYHEASSGYTFGSLTAPSFPQAATERLPSLTADGFTALNMSSLHSSLPMQAVTNRRLPVPPTMQYTQQTPLVTDLPDIRPIGAYGNQRALPRGIHSRSALRWPQYDTSATEMRHDSFSSAQEHPASSVSSGMQIALPEPFGYQIGASLAARVSPETSSTSEAPLSDTSRAIYDSASSTMPPPSARFSSSIGAVLPSIATSDGHASSVSEHTSGLFSVSSDSSDRQHSSPFDMPARSYTPFRHAQPQHAASAESLRRQPSEERRPSANHRMSVSSLKGRY